MFDDTCDYVFWKRRMKALWVQEVYGAIDNDDFLEKAIKAYKKKIEKKAFASTLLNIFDNILREVSKETIAENIFSKLDSPYLEKIFFEKVYLKHHSIF